MSDQIDQVMILAPSGKCGSNYLINVLVSLGLARLPATDPLRRQDHLLERADLLEKYAAATTKAWSKWSEYESSPTDHDILLRSIGKGMREFIGIGGHPPVVIKTPNTTNIEIGPKLFPEALFLVIVRDGRDVVESGVRSKYWGSYEEACMAWADGVRSFEEFADHNKVGSSSCKWSLIRYESLLKAPRLELTPALGFLKSAPDNSAFAKLDALPVYGSVEYGITENGKFSWQVAARTESFDPVGRWRHWDTSTRNLFKRLAGERLVSLGYEQTGSW